MENSFVRELKIAKATALKLGDIQLKYFKKDLHVIRKSAKDLVTNVDVECQRLSAKLLEESFSYPVLSEEIRENKLPDELCWIVDPVDGTHNFIAGLPLFGVSIALADENTFYLGVIYLPFFDKLFFAVKGQGAFCNESLLSVSTNSELEKSMITYDNQFHFDKNIMHRYELLQERVFTTRILGSAIYDFSLIVSANIDARIWNNTKMFDFAAGVVIVEEAGGIVTDFQGNSVDLFSKEIIASNGRIHNKIIEILNT
ncbi:MAG: inositol monophosphatase [Calditrichales bacterium]|nr:inositol monophosphatase [Calditrichales bacterium]